MLKQNALLFIGPFISDILEEVWNKPIFVKITPISGINIRWGRLYLTATNESEDLATKCHCFKRYLHIPLLPQLGQSFPCISLCEMFKSVENFVCNGKYRNSRLKQMSNIGSSLLLPLPEGNNLMLNGARHSGKGNYLQMSNEMCNN